MSDSAEEWRDVPGYEGFYKVSSLGRVRSMDRVVLGADGVSVFVDGQMMSLTKDSTGYLSVSLRRPGERQRWQVHRMVALAFIQAPIPRGMHVCHCDGNRKNNVLSNLRVDTPRGNNADKRLHGTLPKGEGHPNAKLSEDDVRAIIKDQRLQRVIGEEYGVVQSVISNIKRGARWKHITREST